MRTPSPGIRREAESLAGLLQGHAGAHFTLGLIELATWKNVRTGDILVVPDILAQTVMIERGIVRLAGADMKVDEPASVSESRTGTISEELFFEELGSKIPDAPQLVRTFLDFVEPLGVKPELLASLNLKVDLPGSDRPTNFGYITKAGKVWIDTFSWTAPAHVALEYNEAIAAMFNGEVKTYPTGSLTATTNGSSAPLVTDLLPQHAQDWAKAIAKAIEQIHAFERERDSD